MPRRRRARNHGWLSYFTDLQFDTVMWVYECTSVKEEDINLTTLRFLLNEGFVEVRNGFVRVTDLFRRMVKHSAECEKLNISEPMSARQILDERRRDESRRGNEEAGGDAEADDRRVSRRHQGDNQEGD